MSIFSIMPIEAFLDERLSKTDLRVLGAIISFADKKGVCWPRREQISERCGLPVQKISYATTRLIDFGWLKKEGNGGCSRSANYYVLKPDLTNLNSIVPDSGTFIVPDLIVPDSGTFIVPDLGRGIKQTIEQTRRESKGAREKVKNGFEDFWVAYPKKKSKDDARKAFLKINPDEQLLQEIIEAVLRATTQEFNWLKDDGQFIPNAATYLNGKRWEDEITQKSPGSVANRNQGFAKSTHERPAYVYQGKQGAIDSTAEIIHDSFRFQ